MATALDVGGQSGRFSSAHQAAYKWMNETPTRVPLTDWYMTTDDKQSGFQARSVVGGLLIKMLADPEMWAKWRVK